MECYDYVFAGPKAMSHRMGKALCIVVLAAENSIMGTEAAPLH